MKFSQFVARVLTQLHEGYGWAAPWRHLEDRLALLDIINDEYQKESREDAPDWQGRVESTALKVNTEN
jgi:hypothetical protein